MKKRHESSKSLRVRFEKQITWFKNHLFWSIRLTFIGFFLKLGVRLSIIVTSHSYCFVTNPSVVWYYKFDTLLEYVPHIDPHIILVNRFKIESFKFKDTLPNALRSGFVYKYCCAKCASVYYESSVRTLHTRTAEHKGISPRTGRTTTKGAFAQLNR